MKGYRSFFAFMVMGWTLSALPFPPPSLAEPSLPEESAGSETNALELLKKADGLLEANQAEEAIVIYQQILSDYPETPLRDKAYKGLESALHELAELYIQSGDLEKAASALERERSLSRDPVIKKAATDRLVEILLSKKDHVRAVENLRLAKEWVAEEERSGLEDRIVQMIGASRLEELAEIIRRYPKTFPGDKALLKLAELEEAQGLLFEAERDLRTFLLQFPRHPEAGLAQSKLAAIKNQLVENRFRIGVLLPLSGRLYSFGVQVLNGVRLAVDRFEPEQGLGRAEKFVGLVVKDSEEDRSQLAQDFDDLVREYRVVAVIGPLRSSELETAAVRAQRHHIPVISPSATAPTFSKSGRYLFRNALTLQAQGYFMAEYAVMQLGLKRFYIMYPKDTYGTELMQVFQAAVTQKGGEIIGVEAYDPQVTDFGPQIRRLKEVDLTQYGTLGPPPDKKGQIQEYKPGFDAIYLPGDYDQIGLIAAQLAFYDIKNVVLLGSNGWHSEDLLRIGGKYIEGGIFVDGFFPDSPEPAIRDFRSAYLNRYREEPTLLAAQAYDSTMMVLSALQDGATTGEAIREYLARLQNFPGVSGPISSQSDGELRRPLYVIQVKKGKFVKVN